MRKDFKKIPMGASFSNHFQLVFKTDTLYKLYAITEFWFQPLKRRFVTLSLLFEKTDLLPRRKKKIRQGL